MGIHDGHRQRLRSRFLTHGLDTFEEHEVLELLLFYAIGRQDTNPIAHALIRRFGSLAAVMDASIEELKQVEGIGDHAATLLTLTKPLCRRYLLSQSRTLTCLNTTKGCAEYLMPFFFGASEEHVYLLCLDAKCRPICCREISEGTAVSTELPIRKATQLALESKAVSVVLAHNHPCGDVTASREDYTTTNFFKDALDLLGVVLADHIIICGNSYISMRETGYLNMA